MRAGKLPPMELKKIVLKRRGASSDLVEVGPKIGEDAAVLKCGNKYQIVASDPVTGAVHNVGSIAVHVNANDIAASGADPMFFLSTILLEENATYGDLENIMADMNSACEEIGAAIVGGHTEITPGLDHTIISGTMIGYSDTYITTGGARPNDIIILTKSPGIEGASILAHEHSERIRDHFGPEFLEKLEKYSSMLSVVPEARILRKYATSMHDPTEGGISGALNEMAIAASCGFSVKEKDIRIADDIRKLCDWYNIDPLHLISSGSLLATLPEKYVPLACDELKEASIDAHVIGRMAESGTSLEAPSHDSLWDIL